MGREGYSVRVCFVTYVSNASKRIALVGILTKITCSYQHKSSSSLKVHTAVGISYTIV